MNDFSAPKDAVLSLYNPVFPCCFAQCGEKTTHYPCVVIPIKEGHNPMNAFPNPELILNSPCCEAHAESYPLALALPPAQKERVAHSLYLGSWPEVDFDKAHIIAIAMNSEKGRRFDEMRKTQEAAMRIKAMQEKERSHAN